MPKKKDGGFKHLSYSVTFMRILVTVLAILILGMGYTVYLAWHKGQAQAVAIQAVEHEIEGLRKESVRLSEENNRLKSVNTTTKNQLAESLATIEQMRNTPVVTAPQLSHPLRKR